MSDWQKLSAEERARRDASIAKVWPELQELPTKLPLNSQKLPTALLSDRELGITSSTAPELLAALKAQPRKYSVEEVTRAFLRRAAVAHKAVRTPFESPKPNQE